MRIERLDLVAFGHFTDHVLELGAPAPDGTDLHLVHGPNEAGKSTTLAAIGELLYGMPHRSAWAFRHDNAVLEVGARLSTADGVLEVRRHKNRLVDGDGRVLEADAIDTHRLGLEEYRARFSLDERTLEKGSDAILEQQGELGAALFSAAAGLADLGERLGRAMAPADAFYQPRKRTQIELLALKGRLVEIDAELASRDVDTKAWAALRSETDAARERHARQAALVVTLQGEAAALERQLRALSAAERRRALRARLESAAAVPSLPAATLEAFDGELAAHERARLALGTLESRLAEHADELAALAPDEAVLERGDAIDALGRERVLVAERQAEAPRAREALERARERCRTLARRLELPDDTVAIDTAVPEDVLARLETLARERAALLASREAAARELEALATPGDGAPDAEAPRRDPHGAADDVAIDDAPDTTMLARLLAQFVERAPMVELETLAARRDETALAVERALDALAPWRGDGAALLRLVAPEPAELAALEARAGALDARARELDERSRRQREAVDANGDARAALEETGLVDDTRLAALRTVRDERLATLRAAIGRAETPAALHETLAALEGDIAALDAAGETRLARADAVARLRSLDAERTTLARRGERLAAELEEQTLARQAFEAELAALGEALGLGPVTLAAVLAWLPRRAGALQRVEERREIESRFARARDEAAAHAARLAELLDPLLPGTSRETLAASPLEALLPLARESLAAAERERERRARLARERTAHRAAVAARRQALAEAEARLARWQASWTAALGERPALGGEIGTVIGRLPSWRELGREALALEERRAAVAALDEALARFGRHARAARASLTAGRPVSGEKPTDGPGDEDPATIAIVLERRLAAARRAAETAATLRRKIDHARARRDEARDAFAPLARRLEELRERCGADDVAALQGIVERVRERRALDERLAEIEADLADALATDDIDAALAERETLDRDALEAELAGRRERLEAERGELSESFLALKTGERELATLDDNAAVATLQAERANVLHEIETRALDTLRLRLGRLALEAGLNRFRERHRSGMMEHARRAFVALTDGQFQDLRARPDERGRDRLVGVRTDGGVLDTVRMSTGTRLQLFLALRVAAWHEYADKRVPLPFVADDILESFDERRTAAAFRLMADMARRGQVIYLTHHRHLIDIAREAGVGARVHELPPRGGAVTSNGVSRESAGAIEVA